LKLILALGFTLPLTISAMPGLEIREVRKQNSLAVFVNASNYARAPANDDSTTGLPVACAALTNSTWSAAGKCPECFHILRIRHFTDSYDD